MKQQTVKKASDCHILIVDDDEELCMMLSRVLVDSYGVTVCTSGTAAIASIDQQDFDVVITDLKMPGISGIEVLEYAKRKDEYTEVIMMTGYASIDSATQAINQGVSSYLVKPMQIAEFVVQVEKAVASRLFYLHSIELMRQTDDFSPDVKLHIHEITSLYYFIRKLMLSLEVPEVIRITLDEALVRIDGLLAVIYIDIPGFHELYAMPANGEISEPVIMGLVEKHRLQIMPMRDGNPDDKLPRPVLLKGRQGASVNLDPVAALCVPMMVADRTLGTLTVFIPSSASRAAHQSHYLYVFSSIVSSVIEHGYSALQSRRQAKTDSLTGISNHRHFHEMLDREVSRANRKKDKFALAMLDIDNFKKVNDTYGHQVGDAVLIDMTGRISSMIRSGDILARYGGEEFGLILPDTEPGGAETLALRIIQAIASHSFMFSQHEISYTVSIGLAIYDGACPVGKDRLIAAADKALYYSKENGKNRLSIGRIEA